MATYLVIDKDGTVTNAIEWDGASAFDPGPDTEVLPMEGLPPGLWIGARREAAGWVMPPEAP